MCEINWVSYNHNLPFSSPTSLMYFSGHILGVCTSPHNTALGIGKSAGDGKHCRARLSWVLFAVGGKFWKKDVCCRNDGPAQHMHQVTPASRCSVIDSEGFGNFSWPMTGNPFACASLTDRSTASSTCEHLPGLCPIKYFVGALQENTVFQSFLQQ